MRSTIESRNNYRIQPKHKPDLERWHTNNRGKAGRGWLSDLEGGVDGSKIRWEKTEKKFI
jgi:hypothetical protein